MRRSAKYRSLFAPALSPKAVAPLGENARALAVELIEGFRVRGECEFVSEFAQHLPIGLDRLFVYRFDRATHALLPDDAAHPRHLALPPASGPRHFAFSPNGRFVYLLGELSADIHVLQWNARSGTLAPVQTLSTDTPDFAGTKSVAEVAVSKDGRFVYVSNRGGSMIVVYAADPRTGRLRFVERVPSGGENPWAFAFHPDGRWMIVANQRSDNLALFRVDPATGRLIDTGQKLAVVKPVNISFDR